MLSSARARTRDYQAQRGTHRKHTSSSLRIQKIELIVGSTQVVPKTNASKQFFIGVISLDKLLLWLDKNHMSR